MSHFAAISDQTRGLLLGARGGMAPKRKASASVVAKAAPKRAARGKAKAKAGPQAKAKASAKPAAVVSPKAEAKRRQLVRRDTEDLDSEVHRAEAQPHPREHPQ